MPDATHSVQLTTQSPTLHLPQKRWWGWRLQIRIDGTTIIKDATTSMQANSDIQPPASVLTSIKSSMDPKPRCTEPAPKALHFKLNLEVFRQGLATHGDRDFAERIIKACSNNVSIAYEGPKFHWEYNNGLHWNMLPQSKNLLPNIFLVVWKNAPYFEVPCHTFVGLLSEEVLKQVHSIMTLPTG